DAKHANGTAAQNVCSFGKRCREGPCTCRTRPLPASASNSLCSDEHITPRPTAKTMVEQPKHGSRERSRPQRAPKAKYSGSNPHVPHSVGGAGMTGVPAGGGGSTPFPMA